MTRFARIIGGFPIGADFFERRHALGRAGVGVNVIVPVPRGIVDSLDDLAHPGTDVSRIDGAVAQFFVNTAALAFDVDTRWYFPFSFLWRSVGRALAKRIGQFVLPLSRARILTRMAWLDEDKDGRTSPRLIVRTYADDGSVFQVAAYTTFEDKGVRFMSCAFPQPLGHVAGFLRLDLLDNGDGGPCGAVLDSRPPGAGIWLVVLGLPIPSPLSERFSLWAPGMATAPTDLRLGGPVARRPQEAAPQEDVVIVGRHEQRFCGIPFASHDYSFRFARSENS